jgi:TetR/AcrR family transcriptional repressor of nem operon
MDLLVQNGRPFTEEPMARPTEFDRDQALGAAMKLFWCQGYVATSLSQLLETMGIGRSSFYAAFGDKRSLFIEALELFFERTRQMVVEEWEETGSLDAIQRFFYTTLLEVPRAQASRGCMMVNTILELADVDSELSVLAERQLAGVESVFEDCFEQAQQAGHYSRDRSAGDLAAHVMVMNQGLRVASRKRVPRSELKRNIDTSLSLLGLSVPA